MTIESITRRLDATTPGPWRISPRTHPMGRLWVANTQYDVVMTEDQPSQNADAAFIAHAPTDLAALLEVAEAARRQRSYTVTLHRMEILRDEEYPYGIEDALKMHRVYLRKATEELDAALDALEAAP